MQAETQKAIENLVAVIETEFPPRYYPTKPIGHGNPYHCCVYCERAEPEINGRLNKHEEFCLYRKMREAVEEVQIWMLDETTETPR